MQDTRPPELPATAILGDPAFDAAHAQIFGALANTQAVAREQFPAAFEEFVKAMEMDFRREDELMDLIVCPDAHLHREQHARMLSGLHHAASALQQGDAQPAHRALQTLAKWLPFHIVTQDRHLLRVLREHHHATTLAGSGPDTPG